MCGLENTKFRVWGKVHYPSNAIPSLLCRVPFGRSPFPFGSPQGAPAPQSCPVPPPPACPGTSGTGIVFLSSSSHPSHTALFIQPQSSWSPPAPHPTFPNYRNLLPDSSPTSFCSVQGRNSRLLPASPKCCHFPSCPKNAPKEWHQEFCVQRSSRMTESAAPFLTSPSSLELS